MTTTYCGGGSVKWFTFALLLCQVLSAPKTLSGDDSVKEIFSESKRDVSTGLTAVPLLKSPLFNPYFMYPPMVPGKPFVYPFTPADFLLNRFGKSTADSTTPSKPSPVNASDPSLMSAYFKAKKDEFLAKLFEKLTNGTMAGSDISARSVPPADDASPDPTKPAMDPSFFMKKKYEFLDTLFKTLNITTTPPAVNDTDAQTLNATTTTPKPTIVPPDFWFPFAKLPKPTKAPKPTKPPKAKKILKDALDTILLQSLLIDMGVDPKDASLSKRAMAVTTPSKKSKSKKVKPEEDPLEFQIPSKVDPAMYSAKASECLNKLFKILNKTEDEDLENYVEPKATVIPTNLWNPPSETEYTSKLDAFLDLLIKSLNATDVPPEKPGKYLKSKAGKKVKRSTFLDELLHRVTPAPTTTPSPTEPSLPSEDIIIPQDPECDFAQLLRQCCCCGDKCLGGTVEKSGKSTRSLIFKPFGSGYWIPQYLYAAKMGMYLDKLMDTINKEAASEVESESSDVLKRSVDPADAGMAGLPSKEVAINLIIAELTDLKNDLVDAFTDGIQAQKDATPTQKPFASAGKPFKKPFWGPKALPTTDPVAPIQKRIDILNDIFDKLTKVEKTLIFTAEPEYDPKLLSNLTEILEMSTTKSKSSKAPATPAPDSPEYFLSKTREYLKNLYGTKTEDSDDK